MRAFKNSDRFDIQHLTFHVTLKTLNIFLITMAKISIHLDENRLEELDELVKNSPKLTKRNRSALCSYLIKQEAAKLQREQMLKALIALDELNIGWSEEEENCAITDVKVSG